MSQFARNKIPDDFLCPINKQIMEYPFTTSVGNSYEYGAISRWFENKQIDPLSGKKLSDKKLIPNNSLRSTIQAWLSVNPKFAGKTNENVVKPPPEAYLGDQPTSKSSEEPGLDRIVRVQRSFELGKEKGQRLLKDVRQRSVKAFGHLYDWDSKGKCVRCDNGPWVEAPEPDMYITSQGVIFFDSRDLRDTRILPGTDLAEPCRFETKCSRSDCIYAHPFVCSYGRDCRNLVTGSCKFLHPSRDSVVPVGPSYPLNTACKYQTCCSNQTCMFAHPRGRLTIERKAAQIFITHSLTLNELANPISVPITWPDSSTTFQLQGEFAFSFEPYPGTWAKEHFRTVTLQKFDPVSFSYRVVSIHELSGHYCNCAMASGRYLVISFWPYEDEAIRTVWECLRVAREMEKVIEKKDTEISSLRTKIEENEKLIEEKEKLIQRKDEEINSLRSENNSLKNSLMFQQRQHQNEVRNLNRSMQYQERQHKREVQGLRSKVSQARTEAWMAREQNRKYREMQQNQERSRLERFRLRDPIHIFTLKDGTSGFRADDWVFVLDYHKGAHDLCVSPPDSNGRQTLEVLEHTKVIQFDLCVPKRIADIGTRLPLQPGRLCDEF